MKKSEDFYLSKIKFLSTLKNSKILEVIKFQRNLRYLNAISKRI